jgi:phosphoadenosine phosphosulfate reductase
MVGGFSGGKDSIVIKELAKMVGVDVEWHYHATTLDPPEVVAFVRREHPDVIVDAPRHGSFWTIAASNAGYPTRASRWCCKEFKEKRLPRGTTQLIGVRVEESSSRDGRWKSCSAPKYHEPSSTMVLPIRLWSESHVWEFIKERGLAYPSLYDEGFGRLGCVGCPLASTKQRDQQFARWPKFLVLWRKLFRTLWDRRAGTINRNGDEWWGSRHHDSWEELWQWWHEGQDNVTKWREKNQLRIKAPPAGAKDNEPLYPDKHEGEP